MFQGLIDISQEVFGCSVFPGDPAPERRRIMSIREGDVCNLTAFSMCAHNGTHIDAPFHFLPDGKKIHEIPLQTFMGPSMVVEHEGRLEEADARRIIVEGRLTTEAGKRVLVKGNATLTLGAARAFARAGIWLFGNESQTVGPPGEAESEEIHRVMLGAGIVLLEGIRLDDVEPGLYILHAVPLKLGEADGAPCRAFLYDKTPWSR